MTARQGVLSAFVVVSATRASLKLAGFRRTVRAAKWLGDRYRHRPRRLEAEQVARAVATAAAFFPGRAICLEQSVALHVLLRRSGHPAALRVGVQPYPFRAHAWVELDGVPVYENADQLVKFVPFPEAFA